MKRVPLITLLAASTIALLAQPQPSFRPDDLEQLVARVALYQDALLAQVLAAATFPEQIPDAARWADQHHYMTGDALARAISDDQLPWDPSVQALLPFPSVLERMAADMRWTTDLGNAFLAQQQDVMDAVQRDRQEARDFGYLRSNGQIIVNGGPGAIEILAVSPEVYYVPYYDPLVVFVRPRLGYPVSHAITFGFGISIGPVFRPWGWGGNRIAWGSHVVFLNNAEWRRNWNNRAAYVHPYTMPRYPRRADDHHVLQDRTIRERNAGREGGRKRVEDHRDDRRR